ncbi:hypothetical protein NQ318_009004, partial [Aromia moschata]
MYTVIVLCGLPWFIKTAKGDYDTLLKQKFGIYRRDWDQFLHLFLLAYRSSIHETTGQIPASIVMSRELRLPCDLKFGCTPGDDVAGEDYVSTLRQRMDDIHERVRSSIRGCQRPHEGDLRHQRQRWRYQPSNQVWLCRVYCYLIVDLSALLTTTHRHSYITHNVVVGYLQNFKAPGKVCMRSSPGSTMSSTGSRNYQEGKPRVVHFNRLAPFAGSNDEQTEDRVRYVSPPGSELSFKEFMLLHSNGQKELAK